ncbi:MAG: sigma-70 family RNA polymerase sigma factor [Deltaproteobacteria bacterium]|nr:sigma-70 family RNA polymerase sigma factor [Deltaproteobacteria bacterium]
MASDGKRQPDLFRIGRRKGYVTLDEIIYHSPETQSTEQVNDLLTELAEENIDVVGLDSTNETEVAAKRAKSPLTRQEMADPVTMYMRQLKSVPLLSKAAEADAAMRIELAQRDMLSAAILSSIPTDEMLQLGRRVKSGKLSLTKVIEEERNEEPNEEGNTKPPFTKDDFLNAVARLQRLDRQYRRAKDRLEGNRAKNDAERTTLREEIAMRRTQMFELLDGVELKDSYLKEVVARLKDLAQRLEIAREEISLIEAQSELSVGQMRLLLRQRRRRASKESVLKTFATAELPLIPEDVTEVPKDTIGDSELAEYVRRLKNAERRIRAIERKANTDSEQLLHCHSKILEAEQRAQRAKDELVLANQRLVVHIASKYINRGMPFLELVQEGNLGLMRAVDKFDYRRGYKFSTYGTWWIRHAISRAIANQTRTIRLPVHIRDSIRRLVKESQRHVLEVGREPTTEELALRLEIPVERVTEIMEASRKTLRWELPVGEDGETELGSLIADDQIPSPFEEVSNKGQWEQIMRAMETLRDRERNVLMRRFGLDGRLAQTLEEVGCDLGITRERVRQIQARAVRKLQIEVRSANRVK